MKRLSGRWRRCVTVGVCAAAMLLNACDEPVSPTKASETAEQAQADAYGKIGEERAKAEGAALIGLSGPNIVFDTLDGGSISLADSYGRKPVYLKMWATWCVPCREQMPHLKETYARIKDTFTVVAVASGFSETKQDVRRYVEDMGLAMPVAIDDGRLAAALKLRVTPLHVVIGRTGQIVYVGHLANNALGQALNEAALQPVASEVKNDKPAENTPAWTALPERTLTLVGGDSIDLRNKDENRTVLIFLSPWCEDYLAQSQPTRSTRCHDVREVAERLSTTGNTRWIGVASGLWSDESDVRAYRDGYKVSIPLALDKTGDLFRGFGVSAVPAIQVFDADGYRILNIDDAIVDSNWLTEIEAAL